MPIELKLKHPAPVELKFVIVTLLIWMDSLLRLHIPTLRESADETDLTRKPSFEL